MLPKRSGQPRIARFCPGSSVKKLQLAGKELKLQSRQTPGHQLRASPLPPWWCNRLAAYVVLRLSNPDAQRIIMKKLQRKWSHILYKTPIQRVLLRMQPTPIRVAVISSIGQLLSPRLQY